MSVLGGLLGLGRRFQSVTFTATVTIRREGEAVRNPETGTLEPTLAVIYDGPAEVVFPDDTPRDVDQSGQRLAEQHPLVKLPITGAYATAAAAVRKDDVGEVTASAHDAGSVGATFRVMGVFAKSNATSRRLPVEVLSYA